MTTKELCIRCGRVTESNVVRHYGRTEFVCSVCGHQTDAYFDDDDCEPADEDENEVE